MSSNPMIGQDPSTQQMVKEAQANFPDKPQDEALQRQADMGPGREATTGEGGSMLDTVKQAASNAMDTLKQANPATRDTKEPHC